MGGGHSGEVCLPCACCLAPTGTSEWADGVLSQEGQRKPEQETLCQRINSEGQQAPSMPGVLAQTGASGYHAPVTAPPSTFRRMRVRAFRILVPT